MGLRSMLIGLLFIATHKLKTLWAFQRRSFFMFFFLILSLWELMTPERGHLSPQGHEWLDLCIPNYHFVAYKTYKFGYCGFKEEDFPILRLWQITTPRDVGCTNPRGIIGRICKEGHYT